MSHQPPTVPPLYLNEFMSREITAMHSHRMLMCIISTRGETHPTETSCWTGLAEGSMESMEKLKLSSYLIPSQVVNWINHNWASPTQFVLKPSKKYKWSTFHDEFNLTCLVWFLVGNAIESIHGGSQMSVGVWWKWQNRWMWWNGCCVDTRILGCPRKLGSMVTKWLWPAYKWGILGL